VSIRLLHHYDQIGLLVPSGRSEAGYRLYSHADLRRLQQILFYRTLEFPLETIQQLMTAPDFDRHAALLQQRELIRERTQQLGAVLALIDRTIADIDPGTGQETQSMSTKEMFEVFPELKQEDVIEAEARWGHTDAWKQSAARSRNYRKEDWERMKREAAEVNERLEAIFSAGHKPNSPEALQAVDAARDLITRWHYDCSKDFHVRLTAMTSNDERFVKNIDRNCEGLAAWMHEAAKANLAAG
ncbi:MAG: MerR family transcriptional regulator, partial [Pseudomonadota bacterium]|nr:MerR family transcriptional regulator [Pseudomonadota bacterium]